jgi:predicted transcriptional regulator
MHSELPDILALPHRLPVLEPNQLKQPPPCRTTALLTDQKSIGPKSSRLDTLGIIQFDNVSVYKPRANHGPIVLVFEFDLIQQ